MVYNSTSRKISLQKGTVVGQVSDISAAFTLPLLTENLENSVNEINVNASIKHDLEHLNNEQKEIVSGLLAEESEVFSKAKNDIGHVKDFHLDINLTDEVPVAEAHRSIPRNLYDEVKQHVGNLLANGWIKKSFSPYSSPMVCVRKKDGGLRLCIDFRKLNKKTIPDRQPIPRIQEILDNLKGNSWFTTLDMSQAYHQGNISEKSRKYTAFSTPWSLYEWIRIPYGIMNAPAGFQRFINDCLVHLRDGVCIAYLDDILVHSRTFEAHIINVKKVLRCLKEKGVKLNAKKCEWFKREIRYLGRLVSENGYRPDPVDVDALQKCKTPPKTVGKLRSLIGFLSYYRTYIKDFSRKMKPVYDLLQKVAEPKEQGKKTGGNKHLDSRAKIAWTSDHQKVIDEMVNYLASPEVISYPDFSMPFIVHCDASNHGLGAVLYQKQNDVVRVISYASRTLSPAERNYNFHSGKLEFLALKWAVTEKFSDYLLNGPPFEIITDNNPLTYIQTTAKLNATGLRWLAELANYQFSIKYRSGKKHADADFLSRNAVDEVVKLEREADVAVEVDDVNVIFAGVSEKGRMVHDVSVESVELKNDVRCDKISKVELVEAQKADDVVGVVYLKVERKERFTRGERKGLKKESKILGKQLGKLVIEDGVLLRETKDAKQIVLPKKYHWVVYKEFHEKLAHLAGDRVVELARTRFYWPKMSRDIELYIRKKCRCIISKRPNIPEKAPMVPIESSYPFELVSLDYLHLDRCKGGFEYALVVIDHFTKFVQVYATKNKSGLAAADRIFNDFILKFGFPKRLHHDQGREFNNHLFDRLHQLSGVAKSRTTPYHPQGDGQTERMNRTLINMLKTLGEEEKENWSKHLSKLAFAYNVTTHRTTGCSPYFLMFGRNPRLPVDGIFEVDVGSIGKLQQTYKAYVDEWERSMNQAFRIVKEKAGKRGESNRKYYNKKVHGVDIDVGDRVLLKNHAKGGTGKLRNYWEEVVYVVVAKDANIPVYTIKPEVGDGKTKRVHRNNMMNCNLLLKQEGDEVETKTIKRNGLKGKIGRRKKVDIRDDESEESDDVVVVTRCNEQLENKENGDEGDVTEDVDGGDTDVDVEEEAGIPVEVDAEQRRIVEDLFGDSDVEESFSGFEGEDEDDDDGENVEEKRRTTRVRKKPDVFTYDMMGVPVTKPR